MDKVKSKSIIIYGLGEDGRKSYGYLARRFNIIGCSDTDQNKKNSELAQMAGYIEPSALLQYEFDYILITSNGYGTVILKYLTETIKIERQKILLPEEWDRLLFKADYGNKNVDKTFYVMTKEIRFKNGLLSLAFSVLEQLDYVDKNGWIPIVDLQSYKNQYLESDKIGKENAWEYYFEQLSSYSLQEVYNSKNVILGYDDPCYLENYEKRYSIDRMSELYNKYIHIKTDLLKKIEHERTRYLGCYKNVLGVLYRGTDLNALKLAHHPIQPDLHELIAEIKEKYKDWNCDKIFLSTEDEYATLEFKKEFGDNIVYTDQTRYSDTGKQWISDIKKDRKNDRYLRGEEYLTTIYILTKCNHFISGISNGSIMTIIMNDHRYQHVNMIDKGSYAIEHEEM